MLPQARVNVIEHHVQVFPYFVYESNGVLSLPEQGLPQNLFRSRYAETPLIDQFLDLFNDKEVPLRVDSVAGLVFQRLQKWELLFPVPEYVGLYPRYTGNFTDRILGLIHFSFPSRFCFPVPAAVF